MSWRRFLRRRTWDRERQREIESYVQIETDENVARGMAPEDARAAARKKFGNPTRVREEVYEMNTVVFLEAAVRDLRLAARTLRRDPAFSLTALLILALGIGANAAMFSVLRAVLLRPLPYRSPDQLVMLWREDPNQGLREGRSAYGDVELWRSQSETVADVAAFDPASVNLTGPDGTEKIDAARISANYFSLLGIEPVEGRLFASDEDSLVLVSHRFWQTRFGGSRDALGATLVLDGRTARIAGVMPALQILGADRDVWEPAAMSPDWEAVRQRHGAGSWMVVARLALDATLEQAQAELDAIARPLDVQRPAGERSRGVSLVPLSLQITGARARLILWMLFGAVFCVLLIAAANVAGLSLARATTREKEMAVRAALGATRGQVARQLLAESVTLAVAAGVAALPVTFALLHLAATAQPANLARMNEAGIDPAVLIWTFVLCLLTGVLVGFAPALAMARRRRLDGLPRARGVAGGAAATGMRRALVVSEFALAIVLLAGAGLLVRSLWSIGKVTLGFRPAGVLSVQLATSSALPAGQRASFYGRVLQEVESLPNVERAGIIGDIFIGGNPELTVTPEGTASERLRLRRDEASEDFFLAAGTRLLRGRFFSAQDRPESARVAIVNETMARRLWPGRDPVGRRFKLGPADSGAPWFTVAGVVEDMRRQGVETEPVPQMFEALPQNPSGRAVLLVRTPLDDPLRLTEDVRSAVGRVDRDAPVYGVATLERQIQTSLAPRRLQTSLLLAFSGVALLMAAAGIYGLMQYSVEARRREIGIRLALGAQPGALRGMFVRHALLLAMIGAAIGLAAAAGLTRLMTSLLFEVSPLDPLTYAVVAILLVAAAVAASYLPARRAAAVDPVEALKSE